MPPNLPLGRSAVGVIGGAGAAAAPRIGAPRGPRSLRIAFEFARFGWSWLRLHKRSPERLPPRLRALVERLGTTFVKLAQALSIRMDVLPEPYRDALRELQHHVAPFPTDEAVAAIEAAFNKPVCQLYA